MTHPLQGFQLEKDYVIWIVQCSCYFWKVFIRTPVYCIQIAICEYEAESESVHFPNRKRRTSWNILRSYSRWLGISRSFLDLCICYRNFFEDFPTDFDAVLRSRKNR